MSIKESDLTTITNSDFTSSDKVRILDGDTSRNITLQEFSESQQSVLEGLGFVTTSSTPSNFTQTRNIVTKTNDYTITDSESVVLCDTSGDVITITLPTAASIWDADNSSSQQFTVKRITGDSNSVIISPPGAELIDGSATYTLAGPSLTTVTFLTDGNNWYTVG
jgi:hypothetical protein